RSREGGDELAIRLRHANVSCQPTKGSKGLFGVPRFKLRAVTPGDAAPYHVLGVVAAGDAVGVRLEVAEAAGRVQARDDVARRILHLRELVLLRAAQRGAGAGIDGDGVVRAGFGKLVLGRQLAVEARVLAGVAEALVLVEGGLE